MKIILASQSPRRKEILSQVGIEFEVRTSQVDENIGITNPSKLVLELSKKKALAVAESLNIEENEPFCVIGSDTVVAVDEKVLGKPGDEEDAKRMLLLLSGRVHQVYSGVTLCIKRSACDELEVYSFCEKTDVYMNEISVDQIEAYIKTGEPMDKAGAYGIQARAAVFINKINGDYYNVMGLPITRLHKELCKQGVLVI